MRSVAVEMLDDTNKLAKIAEQDKSLLARENAISKLNDQALFERVALKNSGPVNVRSAAVKKIDNQALLMKTASNRDEPKPVRSAAISRIMSQTFLAELFTSENDYMIRLKNMLDSNAHLGRMRKIRQPLMVSDNGRIGSIPAYSDHSKSCFVNVCDVAIAD